MKCNYCNEEINNGVAHISENEIYHLSCYRQYMQGHDIDHHNMFECPKCHTLGKFWSNKKNKWKGCKLCKGSGYILEKSDCIV